MFIAKSDSRKSALRFLHTSRRSDTTPNLLLSSPFPDGTVTTWLSPLQTWAGTRDGTRKWKKVNSPERPWSKLSMLSFLPNVPQTSPSVFPSRMSTKSVVLELCPSDVSRPEPSSPVSFKPINILNFQKTQLPVIPEIHKKSLYKIWF